LAIGAIVKLKLVSHQLTGHHSSKGIPTVSLECVSSDVCLNPAYG